MFVKKFEAETLEQGLKKIRQELGPNALILGTQKKKNGLLGKGFIEITVAAEKKPEPAKKEIDEQALARLFPHRKENETVARVEVRQTPVTKKAVGSSARYIDIEDEPSKASLKPSNKNRYELEFVRLGISQQASKDLGNRLICDFPEGLSDPQSVENKKGRLLLSQMRTLNPNTLLDRKAWAVVGTAGSGKTTSLVKLALYLRQQNKPAFLSTLDSRKVVSAVEMSQYSRMLKIPLKKMEETGTPGIQLIDTPSIRLDSEQSNWGLVKKLEANRPSVFLCLEATHRLPEMMRIVDLAQTLFSIEAILLTKMDLVTQTGFIYDLLNLTKLPICAVSQSQSFKDSIQFPDPAGLSQLILRRGASL
jgi:flagellar biosynthesis protein FlhF